MKVFVTGASGHIGLPVVRELIAAGHSVVGLARSSASAAKIAATGASALETTLDDLEGLAAAARAADGVIHLAFKHDLAFAGGDFMGAVNADSRAVTAMCEALVGSGKPFVHTTGTMLLAGVARGRPGTEDDEAAPGGNPRAASEKVITGFAARGVRASVVRLPPTVHSSLDLQGFLPMLVGAARKAGFSGYVGEGSARWPAVHTLDAARLYRLAVESAPAGARLHAVADEGVPFRAIADSIGRGLGLPVKSIAPALAAELLGGFVATITQSDNPTSSTKTRALLGWAPTHAALLDDIASGHYFAPPAA